MICDTIKELRERTGLSQSALAKKVGVTRSAVNAWEMGLSIPTTQYVAELAQLFHVSADYMLGLDNTESIYIGNLSDEEKHILYSFIVILLSVHRQVLQQYGSCQPYATLEE